MAAVTAVVEDLMWIGPLLCLDGRDGEVRDYPHTKDDGSDDFDFTQTALAW